MLYFGDPKRDANLENYPDVDLGQPFEDLISLAPLVVCFIALILGFGSVYRAPLGKCLVHMLSLTSRDSKYEPCCL